MPAMITIVVYSSIGKYKKFLGVNCPGHGMTSALIVSAKKSFGDNDIGPIWEELDTPDLISSLHRTPSVRSILSP